MKDWNMVVAAAAAVCLFGAGFVLAQRMPVGPNEPKYVDVALQKLCARSLESGESAYVSGRGYKTYVELSGAHTDPDSKGGQGNVRYPR